MGSFHYRVLKLVGLGMFFDSFDNNMASGIMAALVREGWSTLNLNAIFISVTFLGLTVGAGLAGVLGDRLGRRFAYRSNLLVFGLASVLSAAAPSVEWLIVLRCIMGVGLGAEYVVGYSTVSEFVPPQRRGWALALVGVLTMSGGFVAALIAAVIMPHFGWRPMYLLGGAGALWVWYLRRTLPESPRWLEKRGRSQEAERVLTAIEAEAGVTTAALPPPAAAAVTAQPWVPITVLFSHAVIRRTLLAMAVNVVCLSGNWGFTLWVPSFLMSQGLSISKSLAFSSVMAAGAIAGPLLGLVLSDRIGRRKGLIFTGIFAGVIGLVYTQQTTPLGVMVCGFLLTGAMGLMLAFGVGAYTSELFPTEYRFRGGGLAQMTGRASVIGSPYAIVWLHNAFGVPGVVGGISLLYFALALGLAIFGVETNQRSLESIAPDTNPAAATALPAPPKKAA